MAESATTTAALNLEPHEASFPASGGECSFKLMNQAETRLAFKAKSSNNAQYRVSTVFGFVDKGQSTDVTIKRSAGPPGDDIFVFQWAEVPDEETDPMAPFMAGAQAGEVVLPVKAI